MTAVLIVIHLILAIAMVFIVLIQQSEGGIGGLLKRVGGMAGAGAAFASMYFHRTRPNELPQSVRLQPAW